MEYCGLDNFLRPHFTWYNSGSDIILKTDDRKFVQIVGYFVALSSQIILLATFLVAYFSPSKETLITINSFGEANFELCLLVFVTWFSMGGFIFFWSDLKK